MSYYLLPKTNQYIYKYIDISTTKESPAPCISQSLSHYLYGLKQKLELCEKEWDIHKKYTNPYEYVHTIIPNKKKCVSRYKPLSRSYFKMIEMLNIFDIRFDETPIFSFHLAEGPGGFIEALVNTRKNKNDKYIGISLLDNKNDNNVPAWKKSEYFLKNNPNVVIEHGKDNTGNILSLDNFVYCKNKYANTMNIITADGGFDFSIDFNNQEISITKLLFAQISYAIVLQKKGGCFILKIFDCFMQHSIDILYILSSFYEKVYVIKPNTSRYANSEKYIVCKNFIYSSQEHYYEYFYNTFKQMVQMENEAFISRFLKTPISSLFSTKLEEYNGIFGQQQLENIHHTINLIDTQNNQDKVDTLIKSNIQKSTVWCSKYNVPSNFQSHIVHNSI